MKAFLSLLIMLPLVLSDQSSPTTLCKNGKYILEQSINLHDPGQNWSNSNFDMVIKEPRISNPDRSSNVTLDVNTGAFKLERSRETHISTHMVSAEGKATTLLDNQPESDPELIKQYRLEPERNSNYRNYYCFMYGLPMILDTEAATMGKVDKELFDGKEVISIDFELTEAMIAKKWRVYFSPEEYRVVGLATLDDGPVEGEYLVFNGEANVGALNLPRFRHWYDKKSDKYLGSDILVNSQN